VRVRVHALEEARRGSLDRVLVAHWGVGLAQPEYRKGKGVRSVKVCREVIPRLRFTTVIRVSGVRLDPRCTAPHYKLNARVLNLACGRCGEVKELETAVRL
jgi:hypothetical protein